MASASSTAPAVSRQHAVAPLRAGQGTSFLLRRLHSLSGIIPVGAFLTEHILLSNATAIGGPDAYAKAGRVSGGLPLVFFLELFGIWLPIAFHALYGFYIWFRGDGNTVTYPWSGNWMYTAQRWTGGIAFAYIVWHTYTMRFTGIDLHAAPGSLIRQSPVGGLADAVVPLLRRRTDRSIMALRLRHLAVLRQVGSRLGRPRPEALSGRLHRLLLLTVRRRTGQPDFIPLAAAATR